MSHHRIVPTSQDGVEDRFAGNQDPNDVYDRNRCRICGVCWDNPVPLIGRDHATLSPACAGRRPVPTLFDVLEETRHKGAYG